MTKPTVPVLSIVTCTRGNFTFTWLQALLKVKGEVEFLLVYPPADPRMKVFYPPADPRMKVLVSPFKGEVIQRFLGLANASSRLVLALDDDDYVHPDVAAVASAYFDRFPDSWVLNLYKSNIDFRDTEKLESPWAPIPDVSTLAVLRRTREDPFPYQQGRFHGLVEVPIAPLTNWFNPKFLIGLFCPYFREDRLLRLSSREF